MKSNTHAIVGGGLERGVLEAAMASYEDSLSLSMSCRMLKTLEGIYAAGGEVKEFQGASITIDDPTRSDLLHWEARDVSGNNEEKALLDGLKGAMAASGILCPD